MAEATSAIPVGVYPYLKVTGGKAAIDFYTRAFGATEEYRAYGEDGERTDERTKVRHARRPQPPATAWVCAASR